MKDWLWLVGHSLRRIARKPQTWFINFGLPIVGVLLTMMIYGSAESPVLRVAIVNEDGNNDIVRDAIHFVRQLQDVEVSEQDEATMRADIAAGKKDVGIAFAPGFAKGVREGTPDGMTITSLKGIQVTAYVKAMLQNDVANVAAIGKATGDDRAAFDKLYTSYRNNSFKMDVAKLKDTSKLKAMTYQSIGFLITFMMISAFNQSELILEDKQGRTFLRLLSSPVSSKTYVLSNVTINSLVLLAQIVVTLLCMRYVFHIDVGVPFAQMVATLFLFALTSISLSLLVIAFANSSAASGAMNTFVVTPTCILSGCYFPIEIMPEPVLKIAHLFPQRWLLNTVNGLQQGGAYGSIALNLAILLAFAVAFALIAIYRFSYNNDTRQFV
ncbi:ABC transporter permease [Numidum massiliense]|uniref:ABC transporter permease n=1 Tax=Numidum massiliense TaxID=1522315 RepID=UPI0006D57355|nr:ABC transporter permease [Numidum massiliense]